MMRALLLAAGLGTRLRPLTNDTPKCLVEIEGRPLLYYWLKMLCEGGVSEILLNLHYLPDKVRDYVLHGEYAHFVTMVYEDRLLGTGGTLLRNRAFFSGQPFMLIHADVLSLFDVKAFMTSHQRRPAWTEITMMTFITPTPESCGVVKVDEKGIVRAFFEKAKDPPGNLASGGVLILEPSVLDFVAALGKEEIDFSAEVLPHYVGRIYTFHNNVYHRDIGTLESLMVAQLGFPEIFQKFCQRTAI